MISISDEARIERMNAEFYFFDAKTGFIWSIVNCQADNALSVYNCVTKMVQGIV